MREWPDLVPGGKQMRGGRRTRGQEVQVHSRSSLRPPELSPNKFGEYIMKKVWFGSSGGQKSEGRPRSGTRISVGGEGPASATAAVGASEGGGRGRQSE